MAEGGNNSYKSPVENSRRQESRFSKMRLAEQRKVLDPILDKKDPNKPNIVHWGESEWLVQTEKPKTLESNSGDSKANIPNFYIMIEVRTNKEGQRPRKKYLTPGEALHLLDMEGLIPDTAEISSRQLVAA